MSYMTWHLKAVIMQHAYCNLGMLSSLLISLFSLAEQILVRVRTKLGFFANMTCTKSLFVWLSLQKMRPGSAS